MSKFSQTVVYVLVIQLVCELVVKVPRWISMIEMSRLVKNWSRLEMRAVIPFLWAKNVSTSAMSRQHAANLCHSFQSGRYDAERRNMTGRGRPSFSTTKINKSRIEELIQND
ncbi:hypothetical protein TNCV_629551 [Trichonephila clavipes]|nr:hypothetical protein TNCV_629551 [Trichonephila clavipes]